MATLSSENFLERASLELLEIRDEIIDLAADRSTYWKVQHEVIQRNAKLLTTRSPFFDMLNDAYAHAAAMRVRRLVDKDNRTISLRKLLQDLMEYPDLLSGKITESELESDIAELSRGTSKIKDYVDQFIAHHDRTPDTSAPIHRELNTAIDVLIRLFKKYYAVLKGSDIEVTVSYLEDPLRIFQFPWIERKVETAVA
jgi:hypothetical protein